MRRVLAVLIALVTALGIVGWRSTSTASVGRTAAPLATIGNSSVTGNYSVLMTFHDPVTGQEGNGAGTFVFNGNGVLSGVLSENSRCLACPGNGVNIRAHVVPPSSYVVYSDASATLDICLHITNAVTTQNGTPAPTNQYVEVMWEGAFAEFFTDGRFIQTLLNPTPSTTGCDRSVPWVQTPNVTTGDLEKV